MKNSLIAGVGLGFALLMRNGSAFAGFGVPEIDPGMTTGSLAILGIGALLLIERYRARS